MKEKRLHNTNNGLMPLYGHVGYKRLVQIPLPKWGFRGRPIKRSYKHTPDQICCRCNKNVGIGHKISYKSTCPRSWRAPVSIVLLLLLQVVVM